MNIELLKELAQKAELSDKLKNIKISHLSYQGIDVISTDKNTLESIISIIQKEADRLMTEVSNESYCLHD